MSILSDTSISSNNPEKIIESNNYFIKLIKDKNPFLIGRLGSEIIHTIDYIINKKFKIPTYLSNNAGIYTTSNNILKINYEIQLYYKSYYNSVLKSDALCVYRNIPSIIQQEDFIIKNSNIQELVPRSLEPFYIILENKKPWTHYLLGKKILIISPFVDSFKLQLNNKFKMFKDSEKDIFLEGQEFVFYKCFNTLAGNHIHNSWIETYDIMCDDIKKIDFDIALLSCGGYGMLLGSFIKDKLNKSGIYIGGGLQLLFGVIGQRWLKHPIITQIIKENDCKFIRPSGDEIVGNNSEVEKGCYW
jgi:hypothetical protein